MPSLLIVDDEAIFRKGLRHMIKEMESDWTVVGEAEDGNEALSMIEAYRPDFVITDIMMPVMNGIEMQYVMRERYPSIPCIVMSGYSDFEFARESLRLGAKDYITKPIVRTELYRILDQLREAWLESRSNKSVQEADDRHAKEQLRHYILKGLVEGSTTQGDLELMSYTGIRLPHEAFTCLITHLDREYIENDRYYRVDPSLFALFITQFMNEAIESDWEGSVVRLSDTQVLTLLNYEAGPDAYERVKAWSRKSCREIKKISNLSITIGVGGEARDLEGIAGSYAEAQMALLFRLVMDGERVLPYREVTESQETRLNAGAPDWSVLDPCIEEGQVEQTEQKTEQLIKKLCKTSASPKTVQKQICFMLLHYYEKAVKLNLVEAWLPDTDIKQVLERILSNTTMYELIDSCKKLLGSLSMKAAERQSSGRKNPIEAVVQYVDEYYATPITLSMMADKVFLNASYLSTLFKNKLGITFIDYLTERRMKEAQRLLIGTDRKVTDIARATGFANLRHFNRVFRTATGCTPKEYRDQIEPA